MLLNRRLRVDRTFFLRECFYTNLQCAVILKAVVYLSLFTLTLTSSGSSIATGTLSRSLPSCCCGLGRASGIESGSENGIESGPWSGCACPCNEYVSRDARLHKRAIDFRSILSRNEIPAKIEILTLSETFRVTSTSSVTSISTCSFLPCRGAWSGNATLTSTSSSCPQPS